jgi:hypothetical protein
VAAPYLGGDIIYRFDLNKNKITFIENTLRTTHRS